MPAWLENDQVLPAVDVPLRPVNLRIFLNLPSALARAEAGNYKWRPRGRHGMFLMTRRAR
jgi:hypothetical protein